MQQATPNLSTQSDIAKAMQPHSAQNMILPANKKSKKYAPQVPPTKPQPLQQSLQQQQHSHTASQSQYSISKAYNVVSILKTSTPSTHQSALLTHQQQQSHHLQHTQQQQQQQQSYANVVNRPMAGAGPGPAGSQQSTVLCNGANIMTVNSCSLNPGELNSTAIYNISSHRALPGGSLDGNLRFMSVPDMNKNGNCVGSGTVAASNNSLAGVGNGSSTGSTIGVAIGAATAGTYMHEKNLVGVGVGVSCIDTNRKFDFKNNSYQTASAEYVSTGNNSSGNSRSNQPSGGIFRGPPPASNAPRGGGAGGTRHVHVQPMYQQAIHQNMVLQPYTQYNPRQQTFPASHLQYAPPPIPYYQYQYMSALQQQPPPHTRSAVTVNTNVGNTMSPVQSGPNGPLAGPGASSTQLQLLTSTVQQGANTVIGVAGPGSGVGQVGVAPMVGVGGMPTSVQPPSVQSQPANRRRRQHRLQIIDPTTKKNILDDFDKSNSTADNDFSEQGSSATVTAPVVLTETPICIPTQDSVGIHISNNVTLQAGTPDSRTNVPYPIEQLPIQRQDIGQTPIVSAMSDAPSVEILPTPQKGRSKKIPIVSPKNVSESPVFTTSDADDAGAKPGAATKTTKEATQKKQSYQTASTSQEIKQEPPLSQITAEVPGAASEETNIATINSDAVQSADNLLTELQHSETAKNQSVDVAKLSETSRIDAVTVASVEAKPIHSLFPSTEISKNAAEESLVLSQAHQGEAQHKQQGPTFESATDEIDRAPMALAEEICTETQSRQPKTVGETTTKEHLPKGVMDTTPLPELALETQSSVAAKDDSERKPEAKPDPPETESQPEHQHELENQPEHEPVSDPKLQADIKVQLEPEDTGTATGAETVLASLINYNEGQWSPSNPSGKKQYDREQLLQLREAKASRIQPEVKNVSILPQPNLMPSFIRNNNNNNKRVQSMVGVIGGRNSESGGGFIGKQVSMSGVQGGGGRSSMKGMIHVNLSLNQDVKLNQNENAWRPRAVNKSDSSADVKATQEKDELVRRVRGILNKLTPERFDTLVEEIIKLKIDTPDKMDEVIVLVFEKAIDEPNFSVSYARLCHRLISEVKARDERMESGTKSNLAHFRNALLDKTEREFTQNVSQSTAKEKKLQPIVDKIKKCNDQNEKAELEALLEEEERKIRRRSGGTVRFIGELFKISMLTGKIIYSCIDTLLNPQSEDMLECLCKLLTTVGAKFEQTPVSSKDPSRCYSLEKSIAKMQAIASKSDKDGAKVSSRVRFMLQDVIDLRKNKWQSTRNEAPKTMGQIEKETKNEQLSAQYFGPLSGSTPVVSQGGSGKRDDRSNARFGDSRSGSGYSGSHSQRGDNGSLRNQQQNNGAGGNSSSGAGHSNGNNDDNTWHVQTSKGSRSQAVDSNKLEGLTLQLNQNLENKKMGGVTQFIWNTNAARQCSAPTTTPSNPFAVLSSLVDKNSSERDRDRDRSGPRNKGSYSKGSMERDRYGDRGINSRTGSSQGSRENSSSRAGQQGRGLMNSSVQKSASHSKYTQQAPSARISGKAQTSLGSSAVNVGGLYRGGDQQSATSSSSAATTPVQINRSVAPVAVFSEPSQADIKLIKAVVSEMIELAAASKSVTPTVVACMKRIPEDMRCGFLYYILTDYLHLADVGKQYRRYLAITVAHLIQQNYISVDHFRLAYKEFAECANDLIFDIPELWLYILQFAGPLIVKKILTVSDLWNNNLKENSPSNVGKKFLKTYLTYCTREVGPNFTRSMWIKFNLHWSDFMPDNEVIEFIETNRLEYVENESKSPVIEQRETSEKHVNNVIEHIEHLLKEGATADCIIDYSNGNILVADKLFIRGLTETLSNFAIVYKDNSYKLEPEVFQKFCIPVLQRYIDSHEDHQLECLYAMQLLVHSLEHPRGLLSELIGELYDTYVIQKESLCKWRDSKDQSAGKGVAVKSLNPFFNSLLNDEAN
ncbi:eukaryotic translation initiation factor 4 gamma 3 isoform X1 [Drosophila subobscura]|uniref:eukaryotic translation initiation factor 4 gamma 3 isoform X1 n=1 Tax=Drosophila subobscura TaxID=7241 RepID=UPI00155B2845|nr:eukaryotic translation initiation factor 4 gamma 3 isoform X1 [Drosophila subobscura]XP_034670522.1 eukaryotic translation initiation factor 4 gamma 3 isoform X1 [Drosophila subobscura]XP_034670523.1 eukaryotic translation initiation factor 4 gamma 3 isoform X1 [Drosophila subobscura]